MIGTIFVEFIDHVEAKYGLDTVDQIVDQLDGKLSTGGAYTTVGNYPHGELLALATALCSIDGKAMPEIVRDFAEHLMQVFYDGHSSYFGSSPDVFDFLISVGSVIHADVRKLYPEARPPRVSGELQADGTLLLHYESYRPLAELALALTEMSGRFFGQALAIDVGERGDDDRSISMHVRKVS